jgi:hypothetical protein
MTKRKTDEKTADPLPISTFPEADLVKVAPPPTELPSSRWHRRKKRALWPLISVATLSSLAIGILYAQRLVGAPVGIGFLLAMPLVISTLMVLLMPKKTALKSAGVIALVQLAAILTTAIFEGEGAICVAMSSPIMFCLTLGISFIVRRVGDKRLERLDNEYKAGIGLLVVLLVPLAAPKLDHRLYAEQMQSRESVTSEVVVNASRGDVWRSLEHLDIRFAPGDDASLASLLLHDFLPTPTAITGDGAAVGKQRVVQFDNGVVTATVTSLVPNERYDIDLAVHASGREFFDHWVHLDASSFELVPVDAQRTRIVHTTTYRPTLFPRRLFAPIERAFGGVIQQQLIDVYAKRLWPSSPSLAAPPAGYARIVIARAAEREEASW